MVARIAEPAEGSFAGWAGVSRGGGGVARARRSGPGVRRPASAPSSGGKNLNRALGLSRPHS